MLTPTHLGSSVQGPQSMERCRTAQVLRIRALHWTWISTPSLQPRLRECQRRGVRKGVRAASWGRVLWSAVLQTRHGRHTPAPTAAGIMCTRHTQNQASQHCGTDGVDDLQATPFTEELLAVDSLRRENHSFVRIPLLIGFPCPSGWPETTHIGSTNSSYLKKKKEEEGKEGRKEIEIWGELGGAKKNRYILHLYTCMKFSSTKENKHKQVVCLLGKELYFQMSKGI